MNWPTRCFIDCNSIIGESSETMIFHGLFSKRRANGRFMSHSGVISLSASDPTPRWTRRPALVSQLLRRHRHPRYGLGGHVTNLQPIKMGVTPPRNLRIRTLKIRIPLRKNHRKTPNKTVALRLGELLSSSRKLMVTEMWS